MPILGRGGGERKGFFGPEEEGLNDWGIRGSVNVLKGEESLGWVSVERRRSHLLPSKQGKKVGKGINKRAEKRKEEKLQ